MGIFKKAIAVSALALSTTALSIGVIPVNIAGVQNSQPASASQTYWTWWGNYTYLNKQETYNLAAWFRNKQRDLAKVTNAAAFSPAPFIAVIPGVWSVNAAATAEQLDYCANRYGQSYFRLSYNGTNWISPVACR
jgi:hypothetical protein